MIRFHLIRGRRPTRAATLPPAPFEATKRNTAAAQQADVAQSAERQPFKLVAAGSSPAIGAFLCVLCCFFLACFGGVAEAGFTSTSSSSYPVGNDDTVFSDAV